jgi:acyl carrier protein
MLSAVLLQNSQRRSDATPSSDMDVVFNAPASERPHRVLEYLTRALGRILGFAADELDVTLPISVLGLDSLMAVELKNRIASDLRVSLPTIRLLQGPSLAELAAEIEPRLQAERVVPPPRSDLLRRVDDLTDAEVDAALTALLNEGVVL